MPLLLRRLADVNEVFDLTVLRPIRVPRDKLIRPRELEKAVELAARQLQGRGGVVVLLDADDDAPCVLGPQLLARARAERGDLPCSVVLAKTEIEAWFIAALESLRRAGMATENAVMPTDPEGIRAAKGWLSRAMIRRYSEVADQPGIMSRFDLNEARQGAPSFDKFFRDVARMFEALREPPEEGDG